MRLMCDFKVNAEFIDSEKGSLDCTQVKISIKPRVITPASRITFSNIKGTGENKVVEFFSRATKKFTGTVMQSDLIIDLHENLSAICTINKEKDTVKEITTSFYFNNDIDKVTGKIRIDINNGTLQGHEKLFEVSQ